MKLSIYVQLAFIMVPSFAWKNTAIDNFFSTLVGANIGAARSYEVSTQFNVPCFRCEINPNSKSRSFKFKVFRIFSKPFLIFFFYKFMVSWNINLSFLVFV